MITALSGIANTFVKGQHNDFMTLKTAALAAIVAAIAAVLRAGLALLPVSWDDNQVGMAKQPDPDQPPG
jgi:hypothetical protein